MTTGHTELVHESALISLDPSTTRWHQSQPGKLDVAYSVLPLPPFVVSARTFNLAFIGNAFLVPGRRMIIAIDTPVEARWRGSDFGAAHIACGDEIDIRTGGDSALLSIAIDQRGLETQFADSLDAADIADKVTQNRVAANPVAARRLRAAVRKVCSTTSGIPLAASGTLVALIASTLEEIDGHSVVRSHALNRRYAAVRVCQTYMREHIADTITLLDLSTACGMRARSLINAFEAITGHSPMDFLKRLRLSAVRGILVRSHPRSTRVIDVAMNWGFWHMGHFSHDYRMMFGEAPSETLLHN